MNAITPIEAENPRVAIGDNNPPHTPWDAINAHLDDLLVEAHAWADGTSVDSQEQADEASRLVDELRKAGDVADDLRGEEKKPLDEQISKIQERYNVYIAGLKTKHNSPGSVTRAIAALKATVKPYLDAQEAKRLADAEAARKRAQEALETAAAAARAAAPSDLGAQEQAEALVADAKHADREARQIETSRTQARGGTRAMGLRTVWKAHMTDPKAALTHYATMRRADIIAALQTLADADVREGKRTIPGFDVKSETVL